MKRKNKITILTTILTIVLAVSLFLMVPLQKETIPTRFIAGKHMGFDLGPGNLNFGEIVPGYSASRSIIIKNNFNKPTSTTITSSGEISDYIIVSKNNFVLQPEESKNITFSCFPKKGIELREYAGQIIITTKKA